MNTLFHSLFSAKLNCLEDQEKFYKAVEENNVKKVKEFLAMNWIDPSGDNNYAIRLASEPFIDDNFAIKWSLYHDHYEVVKLLLKDSRVDPSIDNNYSIRLSSEYGHEKLVKLLLKDPRIDPSADNNYAIRHASKNGHKKVVELLLKDPRVSKTYNK